MNAFRLKRSKKFIARILISCEQIFPDSRSIVAINNLKRPAFSTALQSINLEPNHGSVAADLFAERGILDFRIIIDRHKLSSLRLQSQRYKPADCMCSGKRLVR